MADKGCNVRCVFSWLKTMDAPVIGPNLHIVSTMMNIRHPCIRKAGSIFYLNKFYCPFIGVVTPSKKKRYLRLGQISVMEGFGFRVEVLVVLH